MEGTHLSRTLGVHQETPALAAILGNRTARRQIRVFHEDEPVDIENDDTFPQSNRRWKVKYSHRNLARPELEISLGTLPEPLPLIGHTKSDDLCEAVVDTGTFGSTRFHITCRIMITDRSRWLPPGRFSCIPFGETSLTFVDVQKRDLPLALKIPTAGSSPFSHLHT